MPKELLHMKKIYISFLVSIALLFSVSYAIEVRLNFGTFNLPAEPIVVNDRILVPLRVIAEIFGYNVKWNDDFSVTLTDGEDTIHLPIDSTTVTVNGENKYIDAPAVLIGETTMVPLKFLSEYIDAKVEWYADSKIVNIVIENDNILEKAESVSRSYASRSLYPNAINKVVVIDAGHGGSETGATYSGIYEKTLNLKIAKYVQSELEKNGVRVYMTRTTDTTTSLSSRTSLANSVNADLFVSVHNNAMTNNSTVKGTEVLYPTSSIVKNGISAYSLATKLQKTVSDLAGTYDKGIINKNNLYVLNHTNMPAVIIEVAYMTNWSDLQKLKSEEFLEEAGKAIAQGILESF